MRVIAGSLRGRRLAVPRGLAVRPTSDRLREAVFSSLGERVVGARFLDVCAGTGSMGIEALSRGAERAVFVEPATAALAVLRVNLDLTGFTASSEVLAMPWPRALAALLARDERFDLVYFDPPYADGGWPEFVDRVQPLLRRSALVLLEHPTRPAPVLAGHHTVRRRLKAGSSTVSFVPISDPAGGEAKIQPPSAEEP